MPMFSVAPRSATPSVPLVAPAPPPEPSRLPGANSFNVGSPDPEPVPATAGPNPDFPHNALPGTPAPTPASGASTSTGRVQATVRSSSDPSTVVIARPTPSAEVAISRANDGLPMVLDPFAVASRAVLVLVGSIEPAKHIARTAIEMSIEHDSSAAIDVVIPRAIDLVLRRAAHLVSIGAGPKVVDHYTERLELWRRLARRSGLEPAAVVLTLAPFPIPTVASMLRVSLLEVEACIDDWYAGIDPDDAGQTSITSSSQSVVDLRDSARTPQASSVSTVSTVNRSRRVGRSRWRIRHA